MASTPEVKRILPLKGNDSCSRIGKDETALVHGGLGHVTLVHGGLTVAAEGSVTTSFPKKEIEPQEFEKLG